MIWLGELCHEMDLTNQVTRSLCGRPLSMLTLLLRRHGRRKDGSEVLLSHKKVLWSMFMFNVHVDSSVIVNILHIENPHAARVTKLTHRTVFRYPADRNFNEKLNVAYVYIYTFLSDSTPKQHEIEN